MYVAEFIEDEVKENIIELLFEDQKATLSCTFDENNTCNASHLFLENHILPKKWKRIYKSKWIEIIRNKYTKSNENM